MKTFDKWKDNKKINKLGGTDPTNKQEEKIYKKVDLVTLPDDICGTNCFNCKFITDIKNDIGFCSHKDVQQSVSQRNCCIFWDNKDAYRKWQD